MFQIFRSPLVLLLPLVLGACASKPAPSRTANFSCEQHAEAAEAMNQWAARNFDRTYGNDKNETNAYIQFFLIREKAPYSYALAFNKYEAAFRENLQVAKGKQCDVDGYPLSPIDEFEARTEKLKAKAAG